MNFSDTINLIGLVIGLSGFGFAIWQYKKYTNLQKIVNDSIRGLYFDSKKAIEFCSNKNNIQQIAERIRTIKHNLIRLDITNRNLNKDKISLKEENNEFTKEEAEEYRNLSSE